MSNLKNIWEVFADNICLDFKWRVLRWLILIISIVIIYPFFQLRLALILIKVEPLSIQNVDKSSLDQT